MTEKRDLLADLEICNKATLGPWSVDAKAEPGTVIAELNDSGTLYICECDFGWDYSPDSSKNAEFIAVAREGWPEAIDRAIKAEKKIELLRAELNEESMTWQRKEIDCLREKLVKSVEENSNLQAEVERLQKELSFLASQAKTVHSSKHVNLLTYKTFPIIVENRCNKALGVVTDADS